MKCHLAYIWIWKLQVCSYGGKSGEMMINLLLTIKFGGIQRNLVNDPMIYFILFEARSLRQCRVSIGDRFPCTHTSFDCIKCHCFSNITGTIGPLNKLKSSQILHGLRHGVFSSIRGWSSSHSYGLCHKMATSAEFAPDPPMAPVSLAVPHRSEPGSHEIPIRLTHLNPTPICVNFGPDVLSKIRLW